MSEAENRQLLEDTLAVARALEALERSRVAGAVTHASGNVVRLEGAGSIWNGIAIGLAMCGVIVGAVWISHIATSVDAATRQSEAYQKAVYMLAPRFAEEIDKELNRKQEQEPK